MLRRSRTFVSAFLAVVIAIISVGRVVNASSYTSYMYAGDYMYYSNGDTLTSGEGGYKLQFGYACGCGSTEWPYPDPSIYLRYTEVDNGDDVWGSWSDYTGNYGYGYHVTQTTRVDTGGYAVFQDDGNFVLYTSGSTAAWATQTNSDGYVLGAQDDGNLVVYNSSLSPLWSLF